MSDEQALNPTLYAGLLRRFGEVSIISQGQSMQWIAYNDPLRGGRATRTVHAPGEEYKLCCPFCKDYKPRLTINHRWGVWDPVTQTNNLWLAHCYNEECLADSSLQQQLHQLVYGLGNGRVRIKPGQAATKALKVSPVTFPGTLHDIGYLHDTAPNHKVIQYLLQRGYDPQKLSKTYDVSYCSSSSEHRSAVGRLFIPIKWKGQMCGWQARYPADDVNGVPFNVAGVPKYYTMPGMPKRMLGYNIERAARHQTVVIVEGVTDVWNFGVQSVSCLGKTLSEFLVLQLRNLIKNAWGVDNTTVVVLLDPDQDEMSKRKKRQHHIEKLTKRLKLSFPNVLPVYLPSGQDPGNSDPSFMRQLIKDRGAECNMRIDFSREAVFR